MPRAAQNRSHLRKTDVARRSALGLPTPRPLYRLPDVAKAEIVFVVEGEKAADALRALGLVATTSPHGSNSASAADWSPLAAKMCIVLPDQDGAGRRYSADEARKLAQVSPAPTVKLVELPDLPPGGDAVEYVASQRAAGLDDVAIRSELQRLSDGAEPLEVGRHRSTIKRYRPFPVEALPEPIQSFVAASARAIGCDTSYIAMPVLSALASTIGNSRCIELKRGWTEPAIIWTAIVCESGTLKTPAFKSAVRPIRDPGPSDRPHGRT